MTPALTLILPWRRASPLYIPRRDLVLGAADSLALRVTVVERDDPTAMALDLSGGIGGPACTLLIYTDQGGRSGWDYGAPAAPAGWVLWSGSSVIADAIGSFDFQIAAAQLAGLPRRCGWAVRLDWADGTASDTLACGTLHLMPGARGTLAPVPVLADGGETVLVPVLA